jgi:uncharacterized protein YbjT (DUF2867 family)
MRVLVTGPKGNVGRAVLQSLRELGISARAGLRPNSSPLTGVDCVPFDFVDPATWPAALGGVSHLFLMRPPAISDVGPTLNAFVDSAEHLEQVVFLSVAGAEKNSIIPHAKVEQHLKQGSVPWTMLRASFFAQNLCGAYLEDIRDDDRLYVPAGEQQVSWVDTRDLGEAAVRAFLDEGAKRQAWTLTGAETRSFAQVAELLTHHLERPIRYEAASVPGYLAHLRRYRGIPWGQALVFTALHTAIRLGAERHVEGTLERVLGRRPRTIEDTIRDHVDLWRVSPQRGTQQY